MTRSHRRPRPSQDTDDRTRDDAHLRRRAWCWVLALLALPVALAAATALTLHADGRAVTATLGPLRVASWAWPYLAIASLAALVAGVAAWRRARAPRRALPRARAVKPRR
jgi:membrane protein implicated in regulation of membrane protease activity